MGTCTNTKEISKDVYDASLEFNHHIPTKLEKEVFNAATLYGYGLYGTRTYEKDGKYYVDFVTGTSCD